MHDLFEWGNDRFVKGRIADASGKNSTKRKSNHQIFMEAIMETDEEEKLKATAEKATEAAKDATE